MAGIDHPVNGEKLHRAAHIKDLKLAHAPALGNEGIAEAELLGLGENFPASLVITDDALKVHNVFERFKEVGRDLADLVQLFKAHAETDELRDSEDAVVAEYGDVVEQLRLRPRVELRHIKVRYPNFKRAHGLEQTFLQR